MVQIFLREKGRDQVYVFEISQKNKKKVFEMT